MAKVNRKAVLKWLSIIAPLGELDSLLNLPSMLYQHEDGFSSSKGEGASILAGFLFGGMELPRDLPQYGISIVEQDGEKHFLMVDLKRGFIVDAPIRQSEGFFENAILAIRCAIREAKDGKTLILSNEEGITALSRKRSQ